MRPATTRPIFEPLEQRLLYSADFSPAALAGFGTPEFGEQRLLQTEDTAVAAHASLEIAFVDMSLPDAEGLISDLLAQRSTGRPIEVVRIGSDEDGIARIGEALDGRSGITAVHVLSHGSDGAVQLGNAQLDANTLLARAGALSRWGSALSGDADLLLYGCDVAASEIGAQMVANLAVLTGADVAASTDLTGAASRGGDWSLEHRTGEIAATTAPSFAARSEWQGLMATFNVTSTGDSIILGSLRWAITQANLSLGSDTIVLGPGTYTLSVPNLLLPDDANLTGDLDIAGDVSIVGAGAGSTVIDGNGLDRVFDVRNGDVSFSGLTIQGGATSDDGGAVRVAAGASASLSQSILQGNSADKGGAIASDGMLSLSDVEIRSNDASNDGGGILISGGSATLDRVTLADNQAQKGGAIHLKGAVLSLTNVTASGNTASNEGGALFLEGDTSLLNATVANNTASKDGGLSIHGGGTLVTLKNTLLANNGGGNVGGAVTSLGHNLSTDGSASLSQPTDLSSTAASIGVLADNGGFTRTHALLAGSAALNTGDSLAAPATDQRGAARDGAADIGAFEAASPPTISVIADQATTEDTPVGPIAFTVGDAETAAGGLIVSASSSNASIIAPAGLVFGGSGANRTLTVTPVANASGAPVTITLNVSDGAQTTSTTFTVTVGAVNDAPLVSAIALGSINEDASRLITQADLLAGASDIEGDALSAVNLSLTAGSGALIDNGNGTWTFTPAVDWNGAASFSFGVSDGSVTVANSASLTVSAVNDAPVIAAIGLGSINEDASRLITQADLLAGASDVDGGALSAVNLALASGNGVVLDNGNGTWTFTSAPNWNGAASFSFGVSDGGVTVANTATLAVAAVNDPATVAAIDLGSTNEDTSRLITQADLLAGASDVEGDALSAVNLSLAAGSGALVDNGNGTWTFTPAADWNGAASFSFGVSDGSVAVANSASLTVSAINDAPAVAAIDFGATNEDASRLVTQADLLAGASDVDGGALSAVNLTLASGSGALVDNGNGTWTFKPTPNWNGAASFSFGVTDGTSTVANSATLALKAINDAPVVAAIALGSISEDASRLITQADLLAAATDVDGDALRATNLSLTSGSGALVDNGNGTWTFTPVTNWNGATSFGFGVFDGSATVANSAGLTVSAVNDAPVAARIDLGPVDEDTSRLITQAELLAGATDAEGAALLAKNLQLKSTTGTLVDNGNGTWTYTPKPDWNGAVAFAFDVSDGVATSSTQAVLDVRAVNDAPVITSDGGAALADVKIAENSTAATSVTATDADAATVIRFAIAGGADAARFTIDAETGKLAFVRAPDHEQPADTDADNRYEVIVSATDGNLTAQQLLRVEVGNVDEAPAIVANSLQVSGSGVTLVLRGVDTDSAAGVLEFNVTAVAGGRFEHAAAPGQAITTFTQADIDAGAVRFVPDDGAAAIDYRLSLSDGVSTVTSAAPDVVFTLAPQPVAAAPAAAPPPAPAPEVPGVPARNGADPESTPVVGTTDSPLPAAPDLAMPSVADRAGAPPIDVAPVEFEPMRTAENVSTTLAATSAALRSLDAPVTAFDVRFSLPSEDGVAFEPRLPQQSEVAEALRERELAEQLDRVRDDVTGARGKQQEIVASTLMLSTGLSVGYVLWLGRGGVLLASLLSALPAWSTLDPLPVLAQVRRRDEQGDDEATGDDDPIEKLFSKARQLLARGRA